MLSHHLALINALLFRRSHWEVLYRKGVLFCQVSKLWTFADLFWVKRLFLHETVFFPGHFTRNKNMFILPRIQMFGCKKKIRTGTPPLILHYSTEHLNLPGHCTYQPVTSFRTKKSTVIFPGSKPIPQRNTLIS